MSSQGQMQCGLSTAVALTLKSPFKLANQRSIHAAADNHYLSWMLRQTQQVYHTLYLMKCNYSISWHWQKKPNRKNPHLKQAIHVIYTNTIPVLFQLSDSGASVLASRSIKLPYGFFRNSPCARAAFHSKDLSAPSLTSAAMRLIIISELLFSK